MNITVDWCPDHWPSLHEVQSALLVLGNLEHLVAQLNLETLAHPVIIVRKVFKDRHKRDQRRDSIIESHFHYECTQKITSYRKNNKLSNVNTSWDPIRLASQIRFQNHKYLAYSDTLPSAALLVAQVKRKRIMLSLLLNIKWIWFGLVKGLE